jgi:hypothetical protein
MVRDVEMFECNSLYSLMCKSKKNITIAKTYIRKCERRLAECYKQP